MKPELFTYGYRGPNPTQAMEDMKAYVADGAVILDIRMVAWSGNPAFRWPYLRSVLGKQYVQCVALGNARYKDGPPVEIKDLEGGLKTLAGLLELSDVVLLCGCAEKSQCHRRVVAETAKAQGLIEGFCDLSRGDRL